MAKNLQGRRGAITRLKAELRLLTDGETSRYELLELIFQHCVHSYGQLPERLLLVCRTFYVVTIIHRAMNRPGSSRSIHCTPSPSVGWYFYPVTGRPFQPHTIGRRLYKLPTWEMLPLETAALLHA